MKEKTRLIILRTIKYSEADLIVHGLNTEGARINFMAKSALKSRKRFGGGVLEPTHYMRPCIVVVRETGTATLCTSCWRPASGGVLQGA